MLLNGSVSAVSNDPYFPFQKIEACPWIVATTAGNEWVQGKGVISRPTHSQYRYHIEMDGRLGISSVLDGVQLLHTDITQARYITTGCNGRYILDMVINDSSYIKLRISIQFIFLTSDFWSLSLFYFTKDYAMAYQDGLNRSRTVKVELNSRIDTFENKLLKSR